MNMDIGYSKPKTIKNKIRDDKTIADLIMESNLSNWKKWLLRKLLPESFYEKPMQQIAKLQKGDVIGNVTLELR